MRALPLTPLLVLVLAGFVVSSCAKRSYRLGRCAEPTSLPSAQTWSTSSLRVATVNMWGIPLVSRHKGSRFRALAERLLRDTTLDVVAVQEAWSRPHRRKFLRRVADAFPYQVDFQSTFGRSGLVIVSRLPFTSGPLFREFRARGKWWKPWTGEWFARKGAGAVRIRTKEGHLWFVSTHLHACYDSRERCEQGKDGDASIRRAQLRELRAWVAGIAGSDPAVIVGDFNFTAESVYARELSSALPGKDPAWTRVAEVHERGRRVDHIWLRPGAAKSWRVVEPTMPIFTGPVVRRGGERVPLSDHCALAAEVRFENDRPLSREARSGS